MTPPLTAAPTYEECVALAEAGRYDEALSGLDAYLEDHAADGRALNDAGAILYALGRCDEAILHLEAARRRLGDDAGQALWNLAEVYLVSNQPRRALGLFPDLHRAGLMTPDLANRTATAHIEAGDNGGALETLDYLAAADPERGEMVDSMRTVIRSKRAKVGFFCESGDAKFLDDIRAFTEPRYRARSFGALSNEALREALGWCDVAWFEWCTPQLARASRLPKTCRIVCRLHRYEAFRSWPTAVAWENVDALIIVGNRFVLNQMLGQVPDLQERTTVCVVPNGVDLERFDLLDRPVGKHLASLGYINLRKNPGLLLQCFARLHAMDPEYRLSLAGQVQDPMLWQYVENMKAELGLQDAVSFDGWQDPAEWLADKDYLVSTSFGEGLPVSILEAMARGVKPLVHTWPGARDFFPPECLFRTVEEFCEAVLQGPYDRSRYREWVGRRFPLKRQLEQIDRLFAAFERETPPAEVEAPEASTPEDEPEGPATAEAEDPDAAETDRDHYEDYYRDAPLRERSFQRARRERIVAALEETGRRDLRIIDLGCGLGVLEPHLLAHGDVTAADWSREAIDAARRRCPEATFVCGDFLEMALPREAFDAVVSVEVIEHLEAEDQRRFVELARDLLEPGGHLLVTTPNRPVMEAFDAAHRERFGRPWSDQPIENWLDAGALRELVEAGGFEVERIEPLISVAEWEGLHLFLSARRPEEP